MSNNFEKINQKEFFEDKKKRFFINLGLSVRESLKMHKLHGLWEKDEKGESWRNVSEHCLVEAARVNVFSDLIKLSEEKKKELQLAAALHDFHKKEEIEIIKNVSEIESFVWSILVDNIKKELEVMREAGINEDIIYMIQGIGISKNSLLLIMEILEKKKLLSEKDIACLVMHYVDDYTIGSDWVEPAKISESKKINDFDRRITKNENNPNYKKLNKEGTSWFIEGETAFEAQRRIGYMVQKKIAKLIKEKSGLDIDPFDLPEFIDEKIKEKIESFEK